RNTEPTPFAPHLYAKPAWSEEWEKIVELSARRKLLLLSYGTAAHHYFPNVENPDLWILQIGQLFDVDEQRLVKKIQAREVGVEDVSLGPLEVLYYDKDIQREFSLLCLTESTKSYQIWLRLPANLDRSACKENLISFEKLSQPD